MQKIAGHELLARLGKTKLRPGGIEATNYLMNKASFTKDTKVLEVACNMGTTLLELAKTHTCHITGVDMSNEALEKARAKVGEEGLDDLVTLMEADARSLPFEDESFDIVINEAMLTMLNDSDKLKAMKEYYRVLKKDGILLTHDLNLLEDDSDLVKALRKAIDISVHPLKEDSWINMLKEAGFESFETKTGKMTLMSEAGMKADEGICGMKKIMENAKNDPNYEQFVDMKNFFSKNEDKLHYIAICSKK